MQKTMQSLTKDQSIIIKANNLHKTYLMGIEGVAALQGVSFEIQSGEFIIILGNSGGGKTTLLNLLGTIDKPTKGTLSICGEKIKSNTPDEIMSGLRLNYLGFVFQTFNLISSLTAQENVQLPMILKGALKSQEISRRAKDLLSSVGMAHRLTHYPNQLSGGQQQRVTIARALANEPRILLLDEPTGDLDSKNTEKVLKILLQLNIKKGITLVMVTHDVNLKYFGHRVFRVNDGKIIKQQTIPSNVREEHVNNLMNKIQPEIDLIDENTSMNLQNDEGSNFHAKSTKTPEQYGAVAWLKQKRQRQLIQKEIYVRMNTK